MYYKHRKVDSVHLVRNPTREYYGYVVVDGLFRQRTHPLDEDTYAQIAIPFLLEQLKRWGPGWSFAVLTKQLAVEIERLGLTPTGAISKGGVAK